MRLGGTDRTNRTDETDRTDKTNRTNRHGQRPDSQSNQLRSRRRSDAPALDGPARRARAQAAITPAIRREQSRPRQVHNIQIWIDLTS